MWPPYWTLKNERPPIQEQKTLHSEIIKPLWVYKTPLGSDEHKNQSDAGGVTGGGG